jgi:hypothetical protein
MTEEDLYKVLEICYASFEKEKPYAGKLVQAVLDTALNAGFSAEEIRVIYVQIVMKSAAFDDPAFRSLQQFAENRFRFVAQIMIQNNTTIEDFLSVVNTAFDETLAHFLSTERGLDDLEIDIKKKMAQETAKRIWYEEALKV